ncbi:MAG: hypothetical protein KGK01_16315 [Bradyrhizobium sp.]|nr:hypothetical protein [Pseudomonadota bacterium]MDE2069343.1 hypothetical protein [Bradyrhizobium sp.]MDE2243930.1 hypothetical protein [Bradyrhizobium sp.]
MIKRRNRRKQTISFDKRLEHAARAAHEAAGTLPEGREREILLTKARQAETARRINGWLASSDLQSPK